MGTERLRQVEKGEWEAPEVGRRLQHLAAVEWRLEEDRGRLQWLNSGFQSSVGGGGR